MADFFQFLTIGGTGFITLICAAISFRQARLAHALGEQRSALVANVCAAKTKLAEVIGESQQNDDDIGRIISNRKRAIEAHKEALAFLNRNIAMLHLAFILYGALAALFPSFVWVMLP